MKDLRKAAQTAKVGDVIAIYPGEESDYYHVIARHSDHLVVTRGMRGRKQYRYDMGSLHLELM